ncbi:MAG: trypsin-like peptidase domain-containing protein [Anaerolineales bacterium]|nr:trypsin-like peptidase domain-containing protein [Anaerolineales bacterium]MCB8954027.1 trypsin-like peptidase domain-containing protein [Ardenticatenales bacterium]
MSETLSQFSEGLAGAVATAGVGVVRVDARRRMPASGLVWSADGLIVTSNHVVRADSGIQVGLADGRSVSATLVGRDPTTDLAVLRAAAGDLPLLGRVDSADLRVGHFVLALGRPGKSIQATLGIISALGESWRTGGGGVIDRYLQTDVVMYPGFSGGPLVDVNGRVVGLNSSALARGVSVSIPMGTLNRVVGSLVSDGKVKRGYLGISTQAVRLPQALQDELGQETGLLIVSVEAGSPADESGLVLGDTIVQFANQAVRSHDDLISLLTGDRVGKSAPAQILRGGALQLVDVLIGERD